MKSGKESMHILVFGIVFILLGIILASIFIFFNKSITTLTKFNNFDEVGSYDEFMGSSPNSNQNLEVLNIVSVACIAGSIILVLLGIILLVDYKKLKKQENPKIRKISSGIIIAGIILGAILFILIYIVLYLIMEYQIH